MAVKPKKSGEYREVTYTDTRWIQLKTLREKALPIMNSLEACHLFSTVHGSLARGDVKDTSDIDVFIPEVQSSFQIETVLEKAKINPNRRYLVQATPNYAMKAHIELDENTTISFPLIQMRRVEREFYQFGGEANLQTLKMEMRVVGVDKRLMLIEPTGKGHIESSIIGQEQHVAKILGISLETVLDRVHAILRRDSVGRTGLFVKRELAPDESFEVVLKRLAETNPAVRRRMT
jgi:uncharacterized protein